jgi:hypothetical protein
MMWPAFTITERPKYHSLNDNGERIWEAVLTEGPYPPEGVAKTARELEQQEATR